RVLQDRGDHRPLGPETDRRLDPRAGRDALSSPRRAANRRDRGSRSGSLIEGGLRQTDEEAEGEQMRSSRTDRRTGSDRRESRRTPLPPRDGKVHPTRRGGLETRPGIARVGGSRIADGRARRRPRIEDELGEGTAREQSELL